MARTVLALAALWLAGCTTYDYDSGPGWGRGYPDYGRGPVIVDRGYYPPRSRPPYDKWERERWREEQRRRELWERERRREEAARDRARAEERWARERAEERRREEQRRTEERRRHERADWQEREERRRQERYQDRRRDDDWQSKRQLERRYRDLNRTPDRQLSPQQEREKRELERDLYRRSYGSKNIVPIQFLSPAERYRERPPGRTEEQDRVDRATRDWQERQDRTRRDLGADGRALTGRGVEGRAAQQSGRNEALTRELQDAGRPDFGSRRPQVLRRGGVPSIAD